jgi:hypothetical protein
MFKHYTIYGWVFLIVIAGCIFQPDNDRVSLARVGDRVLYLDDLISVLPSGLSADDSLMMAEDYIKKWVTSELLVKKAEENLTPVQKDLSRELLEYRNSMLTYRYKMELMLQRLDTVVTEKELTEYYEMHKNNFVLNKNIVKAIFIEIPSEITRPEQAKVFCEQVSDDSINELHEFCLKFATLCEVYIDNWVEFDVIAQYLPVAIEDQRSFLQQNKLFEARNDDFYYLLCIIDQRFANQIAPVEYVEQSVKNLIINRRRIDFLRKIEEDVYLEGIRNNKFKLYDYEPEKDV